LIAGQSESYQTLPRLLWRNKETLSSLYEANRLSAGR
jgi:hypothetical protein